ncbi:MULTISPECIES: YneF family protein [Spiroplasma]|uniref:YneF family protein n=2 Tax=Spiroplasma TaxID=2132 RepID=A0ABN7BVJ1_9MOLU|nr:YneF family protein [Spiroplasma endosymbiont of Lariophagus distinguendus]WDA54139.1 MAG: YneF family protein [Spiroplasma endosymbiont of Drosophila atripex]
MMVWWAVLIIGIASALIGGLVGFIVTKKIFEKQLQKNPPINENMIRAMYLQMGRKPTESQIKSVMQAMKRQQSTTKKR